MRDSVDGFDAPPVLRLRVTKAATDGAANAAAVKLLAKALDLPDSDLVLVAGATARWKTFSIPLGPDEVRRRLALANDDG